ncbi:hypothetical protein LO772_23260 [Yinghuangia sp. ASG 101]|uniref:SCO2583 family membrane protein n=1 Tax=Yinghuangia sp. ASG 101 TaxID=2896848 RepID=UPI001E3880AD|nr:hypothetical protein [Yinghuangia sp. ASG 101]UGQ09811.1 hypothetical protein LO772_23260 [Yinghuangia sp. ASG 101]
MSARGEPPDGSRRGGPDGEDEFRVVFDESFVQAAVLHEPSAQERLRTGKGPRTLRRVLGVPATTFRAVALSLSVVVLMVGALYFGGRRGGAPAHRTASGPAVLVRVSLVPADGVVPVVLAPGADPYAGTPAADWSDGRSGIALPAQEETEHFSAPQVREGLELVRDFVAATQLDPAVWGGARPWSAALSLRADQYQQLIAALDHPVDDDVHSATGWVTRFDAETISVADTRVRVDAVTTIDEPVDGELLVAVDGVFVYAVKARDSGVFTRFTVHRVWEFRIDKPGLRDAQLRVRRIVTVAAPQACTAAAAAYFRPIFPAADGPPAAPPDAGRPDGTGARGAADGTGAPGATGQATGVVGPDAALPSPTPMPPVVSSVPLPTGSPIDPLALGGATGTTCGVLAAAV